MSELGSRRLENRVAFVSGGVRGIGLAVVERFVLEGAAVVLSDLDAEGSPVVEAVLSRLDGAASYVRADVSVEKDWSGARDFVESKHGRLDILVNNAGMGVAGKVEALTLDEWRRQMAVNVDGTFLGTKYFIPLMARPQADAPRGASIINVSSIAGMVGYSETSAYCASKGAIRTFTKCVAVEMAARKLPIRVNSIHPGYVRTPFLDTGFQRWVDQGMGESVDALIGNVSAATPMGRLADPSEIAGAAFFLASDDSSYMTGSELVVDGGWTAQ
ncbi:SDR family NAD(P)-dependent oxidoreductase [Flavisphingomonas formosensis]|uniref:SDR family NAD(P)-dependent oxidoreductase n=1 Tax=Flavisphingomonas formosensis TaxID=861534 RepID=UPI0012F78D06|nr:SDR family oxidoreductase [Sphingomonas formosensis]